MLSGEMAPTSGSVRILNRDDGVAYCPQSNALDNLLTVEEIIRFYGKLRRIRNILEVNDLWKWMTLLNDTYKRFLNIIVGHGANLEILPFVTVSECTS